MKDKYQVNSEFLSLKTGYTRYFSNLVASFLTIYQPYNLQKLFASNCSLFLNRIWVKTALTFHYFNLQEPHKLPIVYEALLIWSTNISNSKPCQRLLSRFVSKKCNFTEDHCLSLVFVTQSFCSSL